MPRVIISQAQHIPHGADPTGPDTAADAPANSDSPWRALLDAEVGRVRQWQAVGDLFAEPVAEQTAATLGAGIRLWRDTLVSGWQVGRQWQAVGLDSWRRAAGLLRR